MSISYLRFNCIACCALTGFSGCGYRIEEAATRYHLAVTWDAQKDYAKITCCKFTQGRIAQEYLETRINGGPLCRGAIALSKPGDTITVTRLTSGFDSTRILHTFLVFEFSSASGESTFRLVAVSDAVIEAGSLNLGVVEKKGASQLF